MKIAVRMDDITPDMDWEAFYRVKAILDRVGIKPLLGIVPDNRDPNLHKCDNRQDFWEVMRSLQAEGWCMALHGMHHNYTSEKGGLFPLNNLSEYVGLSYAAQCEMIRRGKDILERNGIHTTLFMAPAHSYDRNTLKALVMNGFTGVTDGFGDTPYQYKSLTFYPITFRMEKTLQKKNGYSTMVLHANTMTEKDFEVLENRLSDRKLYTNCEFISYQDYLQVPARRQTWVNRSLEWSMATTKRLLVKLKGILKK